jgi:hypothetical protein
MDCQDTLANRILYNSNIFPEEIAEYKKIIKRPDMRDKVAMKGLLYIRYCAALVIEAQMKGELEEFKKKYGLEDKDDS